jgi:hypothetical protein
MNTYADDLAALFEALDLKNVDSCGADQSRLARVHQLVAFTRRKRAQCFSCGHFVYLSAMI